MVFVLGFAVLSAGAHSRALVFTKCRCCSGFVFLLPAGGATDNTTCKGAPRWAPCSVRVVRGFIAGPFAGRFALAFGKLRQLLLRAALWVPFAAPHFATFEGVPRWAS